MYPRSTYFERKVGHLADATLVFTTIKHVVLQTKLRAKCFLAIGAYVDAVLIWQLWTTSGNVPLKGIFSGVAFATDLSKTKECKI